MVWPCITLAAAWPFAAFAQQAAMPVIGFVSAGGCRVLQRHISAFQEGLKEFGYVESQNVAVEYRFSQGQDDWLPAFAREFDAFRCGSFSLLAGVASGSSRR
jgi:hypothetical protein